MLRGLWLLAMLGIVGAAAVLAGAVRPIGAQETTSGKEWLASRRPWRGRAGLGRDQNLGGGCGPCP